MANTDNISITDELRSTLARHLEACVACRAALADLAMDDWDKSTTVQNCFDLAGVSVNQAWHAPSKLGAKPNGLLNAGLTEIDSAFSSIPGRSQPVPHNLPDPPREESHLGAVGSFQVEGVLAQGGMGTLYRAYDELADRPVALKVMHTWIDAKSEAAKRITHEAAIARRVRHPNVVAVYDLLLRDDLPPTLVMELFSGNTLKHVLGGDTMLEARASATMLAGAARGIQACHKAGVIHRDIKPSNLLVEYTDASSMRLVVSDFGIAHDEASEGDLTQDSGLLGTPAYMSPEQIRSPSNVDARSDVYSLGCVLYELMTGRPPFLGSVRMLLWQATHETPRSPRELNEGIDRALETICLKAIAAKPEERYASAGDFADDLDRYLENKPIHARPAGAVRRIVRKCQSYPVVSTVVAALFVTLAGISIVSVIATQRMAAAWARESVALQKAKDNEVIAKQQTELQKQAATIAADQSMLAFDTLTAVVNDIESGLRELPNGSPIRRKLLKTSLNNLKKVARGVVARSAIDLQSVHAMHRLADVILRFGNSDAQDEADAVGTTNSGEVSQIEIAESLYQRAYEIAMSAFAANPNSTEALRAAIGVRIKQSQIIFERGTSDAGEELCFESVELSRKLMEISGGDSNAASFLVESLARLSEIHRRNGEFSESLRLLTESIELADEYTPIGKPSTKDTDFHKYEARILQYALAGANAQHSGERDAAAAAFRKSLDLSLSLIGVWEQLGTNQYMVAGQRVACAGLLEQLGEVDEAARLAMLAVEYFAPLHEADPDDMYAASTLKMAYMQIARAASGKGDDESAADWTSKASALSNAPASTP